MARRVRPEPGDCPPGHRTARRQALRAARWNQRGSSGGAPAVVAPHSLSDRDDRGVLLCRSRRALVVDARADHNLIDTHTVLALLDANALLGVAIEVDRLAEHTVSTVRPSPPEHPGAATVFEYHAHGSGRPNAVHGIAGSVHCPAELDEDRIVRPGIGCGAHADPDAIGHSLSGAERRLHIAVGARKRRRELWLLEIGVLYGH